VKSNRLKLVSLLISVMMFVFSSVAYAQVTLTVWEWDMNERPEAVQAIVKAFEEENPDIKIKIETIDWNSMEQKSVLAGAAGAMPDCIEISPVWMQTLAKRGYLEDLAPFIEKEEEGFIEDYVVATKDPWTNTYSYLPWRMNVHGLYMVEDYVKEAGFAEPPKTWQEFEEIAKKCTVDLDGDGRIDRYGFVCNTPNNNFVIKLFCSFGVQFENPDGTSGLASPKAIEAMEYWYEIEKNYGPPEMAMFGFKESRDVFMSGKAAMTAEGSWMNTILAEGMLPGLTWKPFRTPIYDVPTAVVGAEMYGIGKGTKYPEEAWKFVKFITGPEADAILIRMSKGIPGHKVNTTMPEVQADPLIKVFADEAAEAQRVEFFESYKTWAAYNELHPNIYQQILYGQMTVEEAMKELAKQIDEITIKD